MVAISIDSGWTNLVAQAAPPVVGGAAQGENAGTPVTTQPGIPLGNGAGQPRAAPNTFGLLLPMMLALFVLMIVTSVFGSRKEKKRRKELLRSLARYDRVQTSGGMIGTIVEIKGDEVVLKVDESTNTKIHFSRSSIQSVLKRGPSSESESLEPAETAA